MDLGGAAWRLLAQRAAFWEAERTLVLADVHLGKAASFRAQGVPVPSGTTAANLRRLSGLIDALAVRRVIFLGDLFHARQAHEPVTLSALVAWREAHVTIECVLVEGNHDRAAGAVPPGLRLDVQPDPWRQGPYAFCHEPRFVPGATALAGHLHPCVRLHGRADDSVRLPCFWIRPGLAVLPSFGEFTGGASFERDDGDRVIAVADDALVEIPRRRVAAGGHA
jgi:DNA ligase-associated metallophosphoesterase